MAKFADGGASFMPARPSRVARSGISPAGVSAAIPRGAVRTLPVPGGGSTLGASVVPTRRQLVATRTFADWTARKMAGRTGG